MMIFLPNENTNYEAREALGDVDDLVLNKLHPEKRASLPTFQDAKRLAMSTIATQWACKSIAYVCIKCDGAICLVSFGARSGHRILWNFCRPDGKWRQGSAENIA